MSESGVAVFRGGQRPGMALKRISEAVHGLVRSAPGIPSALAKSKAIRNDQADLVFPSAKDRRDGLHETSLTLMRIAKNHIVKGISSYKVKRIFEIVQLAAYGGIADLFMLPKDSRALHLVYPLPDNSAGALLRIFPSAESEIAKRHGLRLLQKACKPSKVDMGFLVAQLCFWQEQMDRKVQYLPASTLDTRGRGGGGWRRLGRTP